ncbi:alpha-1,6-mannosyl-glycoprotein 2-beta-N-acetylglucosaminyltransferase isoform X1 [Schistocerca nitens]|uniref:alpha-1,6-mannosyl-glycoprotein 2-beta-N-acetylglucosaminyltransferase isoform X1 n=2 Tax=Schistocerca nitens TaxID=7011 RepID=UPI002118FD21|nr:alpha-1,6-mannosyl-glycoprotein 2-beta-N-acetylglucosaminyltransferase isoform X1 [Schistocerca nitens]XP_049811699.1 alpha-1,6-mannosyl-glycoprotein 2-beta-N-acetylglucosaminyltransferase isoform X1 [Schistocerca nitens]
MRLHYTGRGLRVSMAAPAIGRRRTASCVRTAVFLFLVTFVWLQLHVASLGSARHAAPDAAAAAADANDSTAAILSMVPQVLHKFLTPKPRRNATVAAGAAAAAAGTAANGSAGAAAAGLPVPRPNISDIRRSIERYNEMQTIHNEEVFGPVQNDTLIIVVQVHTRIIYLRHLIVSLAQARDIDTVLLIFSHDYYDEEINELVQSIDFCKVMQIFYPFSIQTHPKEFPGESPGDCPRNIKKEQAKEMMCNNALYPDLYGHYREAKFTQTKHHWWWKANRVFNQLDVTRNHTGMVLFLEEDHFVAEDFIHVMHLMERTCKVSCDRCNILSLGTYLKTYNYYGDSKKKEALRAMKRHPSFSAGSIPPSWGFQILPSLYQHYQKAEVTPWVSSKHNMGMAFNRTTWNDIRRCAEFFCIYDDYNWDWSLQHISQGCMAHKLYAMVMKGPRVFHIGECGVHHKKANCESTAVISKVQHVLKFAAKHLYPTHLTLTVTNGNKKQKLRKGNGGWGDIRDHQLCINMTKIGR